MLALCYCWLTQNTAVLTAMNISMNMAQASTRLSLSCAVEWSLMVVPFVVVMGST